MTFREGERMSLMQLDLEDKYRLDAGRIYLSGIQALVRLPLLQRQRDRAHNLKTAGFISGYRGSPLGMYDHALWRAKSHLQANDIAFVPGLNEDLAATAVWGSQQVGLYPGAEDRCRAFDCFGDGLEADPAAGITRQRKAKDPEIEIVLQRCGIENG